MQALLELALNGPAEDSESQESSVWWNPCFKRPETAWRQPVASPAFELIERNLDGDGLGEPEPDSQHEAPESTELDDGEPSLPTDIGEPLELQPGYGGVGIDAPSPDTGASQHSGVRKGKGTRSFGVGTGNGIVRNPRGSGHLPCEITPGVCKPKYSSNNARVVHYRRAHKDEYKRLIDAGILPPPRVYQRYDLAPALATPGSEDAMDTTAD